MHARLLHVEPPRTRVSLFARMSPNAPRRGDRLWNIAFRPRSGDLIVGNAELAKPVDLVLVYSKAGPSFEAIAAARDRFAFLSLSRCFHRSRAALGRPSPCDREIAMHKWCQLTGCALADQSE